MGARRSVDDAEAIKWTLFRYRQLEEKRLERQWVELEEEFDRDRSTLKKHVARALEEGLVRVRVDGTSAVSLAYDDELESAIEGSGFRHLDRAVVVHIEDGQSTHRVLGAAMAAAITERNFLRQEEVIGWGSGRGPYYTVEALLNRPRIPISNVTLLSLTGAVFPGPEPASPEELLDADATVTLAARCFVGPVHLQTVGYPIAHTEEMIGKYRAMTLLDEREFQKQKPTYSFVGVGVLNEQHRLYQEIEGASAGRKDPGHRSRQLDPIREPLAKLVRLVKEHRSSEAHYCPVADICNRLFFLPPPGDISLSTGVASGLRKLIDDINRCLLNVTQEQLKALPHIALIAGGAEKGRAIRFFLENTDLRIRTVCLDGEAARVVRESG